MAISTASAQHTAAFINIDLSKKDLINQLPDELILKILSYLNPKQLARCGKVCRKWRLLAADVSLWNAFDLKRLSPSLKVFGQSDWTAHVDLVLHELSFDKAPDLNKKRLIPVLIKLFTSPSHPIQENAGITLLLVPQNLTVAKLVTIAAAPKVANAVQIIMDDAFRDVPVARPYWIVITNDILKETQKEDFPYVSQQMVMQQIKGRMPTVLEATLRLATEFIVTGKGSYTTTHCAGQHLEQGGRSCPLIVRGADSNGVFCVRILRSLTPNGDGIGSACAFMSIARPTPRYDAFFTRTRQTAKTPRQSLRIGFMS